MPVTTASRSAARRGPSLRPPLESPWPESRHGPNSRFPSSHSMPESLASLPSGSPQPQPLPAARRHSPRPESYKSPAAASSHTPRPESGILAAAPSLAAARLTCNRSAPPSLAVVRRHCRPPPVTATHSGLTRHGSPSLYAAHASVTGRGPGPEARHYSPRPEFHKSLAATGRGAVRASESS